ncbi:unnamed protein product [Staurois parvus]|uniref:Uncharacterized protein n=1 Tax=Staurois parvus TaxID=386267 RepID=A0ABN9H3K6_9NEOB|nr:unnamed protein product [Staurois parvus]
MQLLGHGNPFHKALYALLLCLSEDQTKFVVLYLLTLQTVGDFCALCASACAEPSLSFYVDYHFMAELLLFPVASTLL